MPGFPDLDSLDPYVVVGVAVALVLVQTALVIGVLVPGGKAAVLSGVLAGLGHVNLAATFLGILAAAVTGAGIGFAIGRRHGVRLIEHRLLRRHTSRIEAAQSLLRRRAGLALVLGRSLAVLRATTPALAGAAGVPVRTFVVWNVVGGLVWTSATVGLGYLGASSFTSVIAASPRQAAWIAVVALTLVAALVLLHRRFRSATVGKAPHAVVPGAADSSV